VDWEYPGEDREEMIDATINLVKRFDEERAREVFVQGWRGCVLQEKYKTVDEVRGIPTSSYRADDKVPKWARVLAFCEDHEIDALGIPHELDDCPLPGARECETCEAAREERRNEKKEGGEEGEEEERRSRDNCNCGGCHRFEVTHRGSRRSEPSEPPDVGIYSEAPSREERRSRDKCGGCHRLEGIYRESGIPHANTSEQQQQ
jgi:hypothetical protein